MGRKGLASRLLQVQEGMQRSSSPIAALEKMCGGCQLKRFRHYTGLLPDASYPDTIFNATRTAPDDIPAIIFATVYPCDEQLG